MPSMSSKTLLGDGTEFPRHQLGRHPTTFSIKYTTSMTSEIYSLLTHDLERKI